MKSPFQGSCQLRGLALRGIFSGARVADPTACCKSNDPSSDAPDLKTALNAQVPAQASGLGYTNEPDTSNRGHSLRTDRKLHAQTLGRLRPFARRWHDLLDKQLC